MNIVVAVSFLYSMARALKLVSHLRILISKQNIDIISIAVAVSFRAFALATAWAYLVALLSPSVMCYVAIDDV